MHVHDRRSPARPDLSAPTSSRRSMRSGRLPTSRGRQPDAGRQVRQSRRLRYRRLSRQGMRFCAKWTVARSTARSPPILHQGACSDTTETDGRYMMQNNYRYSRALLDYCTDEEVPFIYASSAAVYGASQTFREDARVRGAAQRLRLFEVPVRPGVRRSWDELLGAGRRAALFQRLRRARAAQGAHGVGGLSFLQPVSRRRQGQAVRGQRRLRQRRAAARFRVGRGRGQGQPVLPRPSRQVRDFQRRHRRCAELQRRGGGHGQCLPQARGEAPLTLAEMQQAGHHRVHSLSRRSSRASTRAIPRPILPPCARPATARRFSTVEAGRDALYATSCCRVREPMHRIS